MMMMMMITIVPVHADDEVSNVVGQDDSVLPHVPVVSQHTHWDVVRHFGKLPQDVIERPWQRRQHHRYVLMARTILLKQAKLQLFFVCNLLNVNVGLEHIGF